MPKFWMLDETPPETPEFGGYSFGLIDESNPAPEGSVEFPNENQLNRAIAAADKAFEEALEKADSGKVETEDDKKTPPGQEKR